MTYVVLANPNTSMRRGGIVVAGQRAEVTQEAALCQFVLGSPDEQFGSPGGAATVDVSATSGCTWTASSNVSWITISSGAGGNGNGAVSFTVAANGGPARTGTLTIANQTFTVSQDAASTSCSYSIAPSSESVAASGGSGAVTVTAPIGCAWTANSNDGWITITAGTTGNGDGAVSFTVAANSGPARTGTLTIAGQTFTVNQTGAAPTSCAYVIAPPSQSIPASGGSGTVAVAALIGCAWTARSNDGWITITAGSSGSGIGTVNFTVAANTGAARTGTLTIATKTFTVNQAAGSCTYTISPTSQSVLLIGGPGIVQVTAPSGCAWTATSNVPWISIVAGSSGSGSGPVSFLVLANTGAARKGTLTIAGRTFTVNQVGL